MPKKKTTILVAAAGICMASVALAAGPDSYTGHGGGYDWLPIDYPDVGANQTQLVSVDLFTGTGASDPDIHWVVGLRGHVDTFPTRTCSAPAVSAGSSRRPFLPGLDGVVGGAGCGILPVPESHLKLAEGRLADYRRDPSHACSAYEVLDRLAKKRP